MNLRHNRQSLLEDGRHEVQLMRRAGYPDARLVPHRCRVDVDDAGVMTRTIAIDPGVYNPEVVPVSIKSLLRE